MIIAQLLPAEASRTATPALARRLANPTAARIRRVAADDHRATLARHAAIRAAIASTTFMRGLR